MNNLENARDELQKAANLLKTVRVDGDYWLTMTACVNSILSVAAQLTSTEDEE